MNRKTAFTLIFAIFAGLGAMFATNQMLSKKSDSPQVETREVLVAVRELKVEETLKPELVRTITMSKDSAPQDSFASYKDLEDRWVRLNILEGEPIVERKLAPKGTPAGLIGRIPAGMRAFTITVNEQSGVSGFVLPDHRVDVIQVKNGGDNGAAAETILENLQVLAVGTTFTRPEDRSIQARTVTLAVSYEQANTLTAAQSRGALTLTLRGMNDQTIVRKPEAPKKPVLAEAPPAPAPKTEAEPKVKMLPTPKKTETAQAPPPPAPTVVQKPPPEPPPAPEITYSRPTRYLTIYRVGKPPERVSIEEPDPSIPDGGIPLELPPPPARRPSARSAPIPRALPTTETSEARQGGE